MERILGLLLFSVAVGVAGPALAHPGDHSGFSWSALGEHLLEPDHLAFIVLALAVAVLAFALGRRFGARARQRERK